MSELFGETLKRLRKARGLTQTQVGNQLFVNKSTVARWESGMRLPDAAMITRLSRVLDVDVGTLFSTAAKSDESPEIIMVDDNSVLLADGVCVLEEVLPDATITGFIWPNEAIQYAQSNRIALAILDIELGSASGLDLCQKLTEINPHTNVIYLTAYPEYSLEAWKTNACGFLVKPLTPETVRRQLKKLRYPIMKGAIT